MLNLIRRWEDGGTCQLWGIKCPIIRAALQLKWVWTVHHSFVMFTLPLVVHWHLTFCPLPLWMLFLSLAGKIVMGPWTSPKTTTTGGMFIPPLPHTRMKFPEISNHNTPMKKSERNMIQIQAQHPSILFKELFISLELLRRETFGSSCQIRMSKGIQEKTLSTYPVLMRANTSH